jgi:hypothetical protein
LDKVTEAKLITQDQVGKYWRQSSSFKDFANELKRDIKLVLEDDALLILTKITPEQARLLREYFKVELGI